LDTFLIVYTQNKRVPCKFSLPHEWRSRLNGQKTLILWPRDEQWYLCRYFLSRSRPGICLKMSYVHSFSTSFSANPTKFDAINYITEKASLNSQLKYLFTHSLHGAGNYLKSWLSLSLSKNLTLINYNRHLKWRIISYCWKHGAILNLNFRNYKVI
jgi:hypothetical protein